MRITKTLANKLVTLVQNHGYWSTEVREFLSQFNYPQVKSLQSKASDIINSDITKL